MSSLISWERFHVCMCVFFFKRLNQTNHESFFSLVWLRQNFFSLYLLNIQLNHEGDHQQMVFIFSSSSLFIWCISNYFENGHEKCVNEYLNDWILLSKSWMLKSVLYPSSFFFFSSSLRIINDRSSTYISLLTCSVQQKKKYQTMKIARRW